MIKNENFTAILDALGEKLKAQENKILVKEAQIEYLEAKLREAELSAAEKKGEIA
jgi:hypothetical protein